MFHPINPLSIAGGRNNTLLATPSGMVVAPRSDLYIAENVSAFRSQGGTGVLVVGPLLMDPSPADPAASHQQMIPPEGGNLQHGVGGKQTHPPLATAGALVANRATGGNRTVWLIDEGGRVVDKANI